MTKIERFEDLKVWQESRELCRSIYTLTEKKPWCMDYRFKEQIRSSSGSVMDNIAEGFERGGNREFIQFLFVAKGSCAETRSQVYRAFDARHINEEQQATLLEKTISINKKLSKLITYLKTTPYPGQKFNTQP